MLQWGYILSSDKLIAERGNVVEKSLESYIQRFHAASDLLRREIMSELDHLLDQFELGLTRPQFYILNVIREQEPCNISTLAEKMDVKPSAITVMLDRLVKSNYVVRYHDEKDRRVVLVQLTDSGRESLTNLSQILKENLSRFLTRLDASELESFVQTYEKLARMYSSRNSS